MSGVRGVCGEARLGEIIGHPLDSLPRETEVAGKLGDRARRAGVGEGPEELFAGARKTQIGDEVIAGGDQRRVGPRGDGEKLGERIGGLGHGLR